MQSNPTIISVFIVLLLFLGTGCGGGTRSNDYDIDYDASQSSVEEIEDKEPYSGTASVEACSSNSGNCYDLDADIEDGNVEVIYFPKGGYLHLDGAELDEDGDASGSSYSQREGYNGDEWEIHCDDCEAD